MSETGLVRRRRRVLWPFISLVPLGLGAWAPLYAGVKARRRSWTAWGAGWTLCAAAAWTLGALNASSGLVGGLALLAWAGGVATSFTIRGPYIEAVQSPLALAEAESRRELESAEQARRIGRTDPQLARRMGIGRPDRPGASDGGLVDVNNAGTSALRRLPGIDAALAARILATRSEIHGFSSLEDLGTVMDLDGELVERLRERTIFLPRE